MNWPFSGINANAAGTQSVESLTRFKILTEHLFNLQLPYPFLKLFLFITKVIKQIYTLTLKKKNFRNNMRKDKPTGISVNFDPVCLPISLLVEPLRLGFNFHFRSNRKTNRLDKPEWFFTHTLNNIKNQADWVGLHVQQIANTTGFSKTKVKIEFMREMVRLAVEKLNELLEVVQFDDSLFAHTIDEALGFEKELRESYKYPPTEPATVFVLTQAHVFVKWLTMEKKCTYVIFY